MKNLLKNNKKGFAAILAAIILMSVSLIITLAFGTLVLSERQIVKNSIKSLKSYYVAEAGVEDILLRNNKGMKLPVLNPSSLNVGEGTATRDVGDIVAGTREITSEGNVQGCIRKISVVVTLSTTGIAFHYGAQVGDGGMEMEPNSKVKGNVFSNNDVFLVGDPLTQRSYITDSIIVAGNGNKIEGLEVGNLVISEGDATLHTCRHSDIGGTLTYVSGGSVVNCNAGVAVKSRPNDIDSIPLPISDAQINNWKDEASCNNDPSCIYIGDYTIGIGVTESLGPLKIIGNLNISNNATLVMRGTIYVTQDFSIANNATIKLDPDYSSTSGVVIVDGKSDIKNGSTLQGSGVVGSYLMILSTNPSLDPANPAINVNNNATGAVFYTSLGVIRLRNNMKIREATGYKLYLDNNAEIEYEVGLMNTEFSSGPSGGWIVASWKEVE